MNSPERKIKVVGAVIFEPQASGLDSSFPLKNRRVLTVQRAHSDRQGGAWEFPGGKIEPGETPQQALKREIEEELALSIVINETLGSLIHKAPEVEIHLEVFLCEIKTGEIILREHSALQWLLPENLPLEEMLEADQPFVQRLKDRIHSSSC